MLSTREDLLPPLWTTELAQLHSHVPPVPFDDLLPQIEQALGRSPFEVFGNLEREPYAAASIAQIHRAKLASGTPVILKIRRPGIEAKIDADLRILEHLAHLVEHEIPEVRRYRPVQVVGQLRASLERELDLAVEARNTERFARNFADDLDILVPRVYWEWTSSAVNAGAHRGHPRRRLGSHRQCRPRPKSARRARCGCRAQDDPGGRLLPRRSAPGQRDGR
jgi:ubiquinone biosynthesis protein